MADFGTWLRGLFGSKDKPARGRARPHKRPLPNGPGSFAEGSNDFARAMYGQLRQRPGNLFFSPFSIRTALAMTYSGAKGETAAEMREALRFPPSDETLHVAFAQIIRRLNAAASGKYEIAAANSLWGQAGAALQAGFLDVIARHYGGSVKLVDFCRATEAARMAINQWVQDRTKQKIRDLIPSGGLDADSRLVLVNAVYFKGMWEMQFRKAATREERFYLERGGTVQSQLMHRQGEMRYLQAKGYQAVDLDYRGGDLSMLVLLPDRKDGLRDLEEALSVQMLNDSLRQIDVREVKLFLRRFRITFGTVNIYAQLNVLGMTLAFDRSPADFSGINGRQPGHEEALYLSAVLYKAFAEANEEGTEAAAATAVPMLMEARRPPKPPPMPIFRADHPFLFAIRDRISGVILFLGRIADPTRQG